MAETAQLVEKMFSEFSALQGLLNNAPRTACVVVTAVDCLTLPPFLAVEFLALKSKGSVVPGDSHDVAALHAALESKDRRDLIRTLRLISIAVTHRFCLYLFKSVTSGSGSLILPRRTWPGCLWIMLIWRSFSR